jgi:hypothetical protein
LESGGLISIEIRRTWLAAQQSRDNRHLALNGKHV